MMDMILLKITESSIHDLKVFVNGIASKKVIFGKMLKEHEFE